MIDTPIREDEVIREEPRPLRDPAITWRIVQISDLHLTRHWDQQRGRAGLVEAYNVALMEALPTALRRVTHERIVDVVVVTGDVVTNGSRRAFGVAREFLFGPTSESRARDPNPTLGRAQSGVVAVPGNHDRYRYRLPLQRAGSRFEDLLDTQRRYPHLRVFPPNQNELVAPLHIVAFDSTRIIRRGGQKPKRFRAIWDDVAKGVIFPGESNRMVEILRSEDPDDRAFRVVVLHHHAYPTTPECTSVGDEFKQLDYAAVFRDCCEEAAVDAVIFGHKHCCYQVPVEGLTGHHMAFQASPSTLVLNPDSRGARIPGFMVHDFISTSGNCRLETTRYEWSDGSYKALQAPFRVPLRPR